MASLEQLLAKRPVALEVVFRISSVLNLTLELTVVRTTVLPDEFVMDVVELTLNDPAKILFKLMATGEQPINSISIISTCIVPAPFRLIPGPALGSLIKMLTPSEIRRLPADVPTIPEPF